MALFGLFGEKKGGPPSNEFDENGQKAQPEASVNPTGDIDFMKNAVTGAVAAESGAVEPTANLEATAIEAEQVQQPQSATQPEVASATDVEAVAANVDQQLASEGFVPSGKVEVAVQPEAAPESVDVQSASPTEPVSLEAPQVVTSDTPEQLTSGDETQKAA